MNNTRSRRFLGATAALGIAASLLSSAVPASAKDVPEAAISEASMSFTGFDAEVAAENGYAIRIIDGFEWSVPITNSPDNTTDGVQGNAVANGEVQALNTVNGLCGTSSLYYTGNYNNEFLTTYRIYESYGAPLGHVWRVASRTTTGLYMWNLDGLPTWGTQGWSARRNLSTENGNPTSIEVLTGSVTTNRGSVCITGNPYDNP